MYASNSGVPSVRYGEVAVLEPELELRREVPRPCDVHLRELVADPAAPRMEDHPDAPALVDAELEEVVPRAERAELAGRLDCLVRRQLGRRGAGREPVVGGALDAIVPAPDPRRDGGLDAAEQRVERVGQLVLGQVELGRDHAAADVDPDRGGDDGPGRRDDRADGRAETDVRVRHERDVTRDDGQARGLLRLGDGLRVDVTRPGHESRVDDGGHAPLSLMFFARHTAICAVQRAKNDRCRSGRGEELGGALGDRDRRDVGRRAGDHRHHGRVDDAQTVDAVDREVVADHGVAGVGRAHSAGADRVVPRARRPTARRPRGGRRRRSRRRRGGRWSR